MIQTQYFGCDFTSLTKYHLNNHVQSVHEGLTYSCNLCNYQGQQKVSLRRHKLIHHSQS